VAGFGGLRDHGGKVTLAPRLPSALSRLVFRLCIHGTRLRVEVGPGRVRYTIISGDPLTLSHHGEPFTVAHGSPVERAIPPIEAGPAPSQPAGRPPGLHRDDEQA
jgi:alpha,alpha-trehalose phosphorylase